MKNLVRFLILTLCLYTPNLFAHSHEKEVKIKTTKVSDGIYMLQGKGGI